MKLGLDKAWLVGVAPFVVASLIKNALRAALVDAIDRLKPAQGAESGEQTLHYAILHDEYVLGHSTVRIMTRRSISESTLHRYRREAIRAVAQDLETREEALAQPRA